MECKGSLKYGKDVSGACPSLSPYQAFHSSCRVNRQDNMQGNDSLPHFFSLCANISHTSNNSTNISRVILTLFSLRFEMMLYVYELKIGKNSIMSS